MASGVGQPRCPLALLGQARLQSLTRGSFFLPPDSRTFSPGTLRLTSSAGCLGDGRRQPCPARSAVAQLTAAVPYQSRPPFPVPPHCLQVGHQIAATLWAGTPVAHGPGRLWLQIVGQTATAQRVARLRWGSRHASSAAERSAAEGVGDGSFVLDPAHGLEPGECWARFFMPRSPCAPLSLPSAWFLLRLCLAGSSCQQGWGTSQQWHN